MIKKAYDLICIGGGSAGFNGARLAASLGWKVAVVDGAKQLGGLCILKGCMPSKTLLYAAEILHHARHADRFGLKVTGARADMRAVHARKRRIIGEFADYRVQALKRGKFDLIRAHARFVDPHTIELSNGRRLRAKHFLIGTGSKVSVPPVPGLREAKFWTSDDVLDLDFTPKSVIVLGGGNTAIDAAVQSKKLGAESVTLVYRRGPEAMSATFVEQAFARDQGVLIRHWASPRRLLLENGELQAIEFETQTLDAAGNLAGTGEILRLDADMVLKAVGQVLQRAPLTGEPAPALARGRVVVDAEFRTTVPGVWAGGDCVGVKLDLTVQAVEDGKRAAQSIDRALRASLPG